MQSQESYNHLNLSTDSKVPSLIAPALAPGRGPVEESTEGVVGADAPQTRTLMDVNFLTGPEADAAGPTSSKSLGKVLTTDVVPSRAVLVSD